MATAETDTTFDLGVLTERFTVAWNECDTALMAELVTEDVVWSDPALPEPARGVAEVQEFMRRCVRTFPDLSFTESDPPHLSREGNQVAWGWKMAGTMRGYIDPPGFAPTGRGMEVQGVDIWELDGGRISRYRAYYDLNEMVRQLGILPPVGSRAERASAVLQRIQARLARR